MTLEDAQAEVESLRKQLALANARCARLAEKLGMTQRAHRGGVKALKARIAELEAKV